MKPIRLMSGFLTVSFWTQANRVLGFVCEIMILSFIGLYPLEKRLRAAITEGAERV